MYCLKKETKTELIELLKMAESLINLYFLIKENPDTLGLNHVKDQELCTLFENVVGDYLIPCLKSVKCEIDQIYLSETFEPYFDNADEIAICLDFIRQQLK